MARQTPPRPVDVEALFPELVPFGRSAVRLHPRAGTPGREDSSVGGPLLWPADEAWPMCGGEHPVWDGGIPLEGGIPTVPILQVFRRDVPQANYPEGTDVLQVLWCPAIIECCPEPTPRVYWRDSGAIVDALDMIPAPSSAMPRECIPSPCVVHPEEVREYPSWDIPDDLFASMRDRFEQLREERGWHYFYHLAEAPGIKLGGYPSWTQEPCWPECETCGGVMEHLLTVSSWECDGESWRTWAPIEDRGGATGREDQFPRGLTPASEAASLMIGDAGGVYIFECTKCAHRPVAHWWDCS